MAFDQTGNCITVSSPTSRTRAARFGQQFAEHAVGGFRSGGHHEHIAGLDYVDGGVNHQVVARMAGDGNRGAGDACRRVDGPHIWTHEAGAILRLMHGSDTQLAQQSDDAGVRPLHAALDDGLHASVSVTCG
jgi:hypothetical protein